jgi:hypothetical protein
MLHAARQLPSWLTYNVRQNKMADAKHPIRNSVIASLITAAVTGLLLAIIPGGWPWVVERVGDGYCATAKWLRAPIEIPAWMLILLVLVACGVLAVGIIVVVAILRGSPAEPPKVTEGEFFGIKWRWGYGPGGIERMATFCPVCDLQVHPKDGSQYRAIDSTVFRCDDGHWESELFDCSYEDLEDRVRRKIQQRLRSENRA